MPRIGEERREARREQILDAARACLLEHGLEAVSMEMIIARSGPRCRPGRPGAAYSDSRYNVLRYSGLRYSVGRAEGTGAREESDVGDRLDRWADPPLLVLASLADEPKHGYAITQDVAETMGVRLSAGTLYAVISRLEARGLIEPLESEDRRRPYRITAAGARELARQSERMSRVASLATERLRAHLGWAGA
jgi:DNA-binding PadR family transcriptional regulator